MENLILKGKIMGKKKISVIVTVYNRLEYVRNVVLSLINQTKQIDELILADDGSKDDVKMVIDDLFEKCKFSIKHIYQEDLGFRLARSRNNGAREAEGEFLIFLDQDVILPDDFVEKVYEKRKEKMIVFCRGYLTSEEEKNKIFKFMNQEKYNYKKIYELAYNKYSAKILNKVVFKDKLYRILYWLKLRSRGTKMVGLMFALYKKDYIAINGFDDKYKGWGQEDDDFGNRFFKYGGEVYPLKLKKEYLFHMYHPFAKSKAASLNVDYYHKRKKEISKNNYKCENGFFNSVDQDEYVVRKLKD